MNLEKLKKTQVYNFLIKALLDKMLESFLIAPLSGCRGSRVQINEYFNQNFSLAIN